MDRDVPFHLIFIMSTTSSLLKFQIGPVQDFIAAARSTRDLWSGSYLLSWLVAVGIRELQKKGGVMIFPNSSSGQPLLDLDGAKPSDDHTRLLTPNLPNVFIATVNGDAAELAQSVSKKIRKEWQAIAEAVWSKRQFFKMPDHCKDRFFAQVERHLSISWQATPLGDDYVQSYQRNGWLLDSVRQTRAFDAWEPRTDHKAWKAGTDPFEKDSLTGREEALIGGEKFKETMAEEDGEYASLFSKHSDYLGAISIIKRVWHLAYLKHIYKLKTSSHEFKIRSIPAIAAREEKLDDNEDTSAGSGDKYIAAIAFDGDSIGKWVNGNFLPSDEPLEKHHREFSNSLSDFALNRVRKIVEKTSEIDPTSGRSPHSLSGHLIYAGGDDVVALVPADIALQIASELRSAFKKSTENTPSTGDKPEASVGIAIAHINAPLQDLIKEAQKAEKHAKKEIGRPAFSITLLKRSGEISHWGGKWPSGGFELYQLIASLLHFEKLSAKFPYRICELLTPYLESPQSSARNTKAPDSPTFDSHAIIQSEFAFALSRQTQTTSKFNQDDRDKLEHALTTYLDHLGSDSQTPVTSLINLCTTVAFANRTRRETSSK